MPNTITLIPGSSRDLPVQCKDLAGNPCVFQAADTLACGFWQAGASAAAFAPLIDWNTKGGIQTGYDQGQILVSFTIAQTSNLQPNVKYHLWAERTLGSDATKTEEIAHFLANVETKA